MVFEADGIRDLMQWLLGVVLFNGLAPHLAEKDLGRMTSSSSNLHNTQAVRHGVKYYSRTSA